MGSRCWGRSWGACGETRGRPPWRDALPPSVQGLRAGGHSLPCTWGRRVSAEREGCPRLPIQAGGVPGPHARVGKPPHLSPGPQGVPPTPPHCSDAYRRPVPGNLLLGPAASSHLWFSGSRMVPRTAWLLADIHQTPLAGRVVGCPPQPWKREGEENVLEASGTQASTVCGPCRCCCWQAGAQRQGWTLIPDQSSSGSATWAGGPSSGGTCGWQRVPRGAAGRPCLRVTAHTEVLGDGGHPHGLPAAPSLSPAPALSACPTAPGQGPPDALRQGGGASPWGPPAMPRLGGSSLSARQGRGHSPRQRCVSASCVGARWASEKAPLGGGPLPGGGGPPVRPAPHLL